MVHPPRRMTLEERDDLVRMLIADMDGLVRDLKAVISIPLDKIFIKESGTDVYVLEKRGHNQHNKNYPYLNRLAVDKDVWEDE